MRYDMNDRSGFVGLVGDVLVDGVVIHAFRDDQIEQLARSIVNSVEADFSFGSPYTHAHVVEILREHQPLDATKTPRRP